MYHSVADVAESEWIEPANHVPAVMFRRQMEFLARERNVVALGDLAVLLRAGKMPTPGTVVLTFDDGYLDNYTVAAPILEALELRASLFVPTGYVSREQNQWIDEIYAIFKHRTRNALSMSIDGESVSGDLTIAPVARAVYRTLCSIALRLSLSDRTSLIQALRSHLHPNAAPPRLTMSWDELRSLIREFRCFELGSHGVDHLDLTSVSSECARTELTGSATAIAERTGAHPSHLSFPYGRSSTSLRLLAAALGYTAACGWESNPLVTLTSNPMALPRIVAPRSMGQFAYLTSAANTGWLHRVMR